MEKPAQKKIRKEGSVSKNDNDATRSNENTLDSNNHLTYDILRNIFQYLNVWDLASAAMVCRSWLEAANHEKRKRGPYRFIYGYRHRVLLCHLLKDQIGIKPSIGFIFFAEDSRNYRDIDCIEAFLPADKGIMLYSERIHNRMVHPFSEKVSWVFLPQFPKVRIEIFELSKHHDRNTIWKTREYEKISTIINHHHYKTPNDETCFMLFCNKESQITAENWASTIKKREGYKIASVWGGILQDKHTLYSDSVTGFNSGKIDDTVVAILITGFIQTWSIVLEKKCSTEKWVEAKLKSFRDKVNLNKHSIGFMFAYNESLGTRVCQNSAESKIFERLFPKVPLVGCFGDIQFGKTTIVDYVKEEEYSKEKHKCKKSESWTNEFSTVFLILTYR